jgi:hypothetical protein
MSHLTNGYSSYASQNKKYEPREVRISGLPDDWKAVVNENSGNVQFVHIPTGFLQNNVPPGYADRVDDDDEVYGSDCENASRQAVRGGHRGGRKSRNGGVVDMTSGDGDDLDLDEDDEGDLDDDLASDNCDDEEDAAADLDTSMTAVDGDVNPNERNRGSGTHSQQKNSRRIFVPKVGRTVRKEEDDVLNTSFVRSDTDDMVDDEEVVGVAGDDLNDTSDL